MLNSVRSCSFLKGFSGQIAQRALTHFQVIIDHSGMWGGRGVEVAPTRDLDYANGTVLPHITFCCQSSINYPTPEQNSNLAVQPLA